MQNFREIFSKFNAKSEKIEYFYAVKCNIACGLREVRSILDDFINWGVIVFPGWNDTTEYSKVTKIDLDFVIDFSELSSILGPIFISQKEGKY